MKIALVLILLAFGLRTVGAQTSTDELKKRFDQTVKASRATAVRMYPDVTVATSPLVARIVQLDAQMETDQDPLFYSPRKPLILAEMAAIELGIAPVNGLQARASVPATQAPAYDPRTSSSDTVRQLFGSSSDSGAQRYSVSGTEGYIGTYTVKPAQ